MHSGKGLDSQAMEIAQSVKPKRPIIGYSLYVLAATCWAINGTASKVILNDFPDAARVTQFRATGAAIILFAYVLITNRKAFRLTKRELKIFPFYGITGMAFAQWFYYVAISRMPINISLLLEFTAPLFVVMWVRFIRKEPVRHTLWLGLMCAFTGLALAAQIWNGFNLDPIGFAAALTSMAALVVFFLLGDHVGKERDAVSATMWALIFVAGFWAIMRPVWTFPWEVLTHTVTPFTNSEMTSPIWPFFATMVIIGTVVPFTLVVLSIHHIGGAGASIVALSEVPIATVIAWIFLSQILNAVQMVGAAIVILGIIIAERARVTPPATQLVAEELTVTN